ncbi:uncharacterized protein LOC122665709 [Telopea speciosissima]|uniref:uncharacterized protein LOC122665709 n=1 Tax=Telopea speciosissima TaxID=54955 RepID=UPI001CC6E2F5|nr:uncharacterized protein LOC122665709 [Telopea speciosissima]
MVRVREVTKAWALKDKVHLKSIGKGFIIFRFSNAEDMTAVWKRGPLHVDGQTLRLQQWRKDFQVHEQSITHRLIWVRFPNLPQEYWHDEILLSITKAVGQPVAIDQRTKDTHYGHFLRVCVDVDDFITWVEEVFVEREQEGSSELFVFKQQVIFEEPLSWCAGCPRYGHKAEVCPGKKRVEAPADPSPGANYIDPP